MEVGGKLIGVDTAMRPRRLGVGGSGVAPVRIAWIE